MTSISKTKAAAWTVATIVAPLVLSMLATSVYIGAWFGVQASGGQPHDGPPPTDVIQRGVLLVSGAGLWLTLAIWWWLNRPTPFEELFATRTDRIAQDALIGLLLGSAWVLIYGAMGWPEFSAMFRLDHAKLESLAMSISAGVCEELLFRGFLIGIVARAGGGRFAQLVWTSIAFGLAHIMWGPIGVLFTVVLGASFAAVTLWRGNVWPAVVAHTWLNLCIEPGLLEKAMSYVPR